MCGGNGTWKEGGQKQPCSGWLEQVAGYLLQACAISRPQGKHR